MYKYLLIFICMTFPAMGNAQNQDEVLVSINKGKALATYYVQKDDNLYSIAQLFSVPAVLLSQTNDIPFYEKLAEGRKIGVPIGTYNYALSKGNKHKPLIYTASPSDNYSLIAQALGIGIADLMALNKDQAMAQLANNKVMLGYIQYNFVAPVAATKPDTQIAAAAAVATIAADTASELLSVGAPSEFENAYKYQTNNETTVDSLEGMVVFFKPQTAVNDQMLYAFSNDLAKGRILKVYNPSNKRYVLTKVIGKLPNTKQYLNAKIGLDGRAREMLETREIKLWCSFYFKY